MSIRRDWSKLENDQFLRKYAPVFEFLFVLAIVIGALAIPDRVHLSWELVALIILLVAIPYVPLIKRISYGNWEAELESLVRTAEESVQPAVVAEEDSDVERRAAELENMLQRQLEEDPKVALAKLRMEMEEVLKQFAIERGFNQETDYIRFYDVLEFLRERAEVMDRDLYQDIRRTREVANEAIHGGQIDPDTANRIIRVGLRVLERIYYEADTEINPDPSMPAYSQADRNRVGK